MPETYDPKHIVVACIDKPGKLFLALPVFQTLKSSFPGARITALVREGAEIFFQGNPAIDNVEIKPERERLFHLVGRLRSMKADTIIHLPSDPKILLAAWLAKIPVRVGVDHKWHSLFLTHRARVNRAVSDRNEVEYNFELLKTLGVTRFAEKIDFPLGEADKTKAREILSQKGIAPGTPYVLVHPGSKGRSRHWKAERFGQLLGFLCQVKGLRVVLTADRKSVVDPKR